MISSSRNVFKSTEIKEVRAYIPPVQTFEQEPAPVKRKTPESGALKIQMVQFADVEEPKERAVPEPEELPEELLESVKDAEKIRQEAESIRQEAEEQALLQKKEAAEQGYQEGYEEGRKDGYIKAYEEYEKRLSAELENFKRDMQQALASVEEAKEHRLQTYLEELKDCAIAVGEKVIHISLQSSGAIIRRMIMAETEKLKKTAWVRIYMGKTDYDMMMQGDEDVISELSRLSDHVKFVVMNKEKRGDCIIEMPNEIIDISVDTQMENIRKILENV